MTVRLVTLLLLSWPLVGTSLPHLGRRPSFVPVPAKPSSTAAIPLDGFVSYSLEFSSFPDFAGNRTHPNDFSDNLLNNIAELAGTKPFIRVGGNTQDLALFNRSQDVGLIGLYNPNITVDFPTTITFGPAFFESYHTWADTKFIHGFNLGANSSLARQALIDSVPYACRALEGGKLLHWEMGNEPDLFTRSVRPSTWHEAEYVSEWLNHTRQVLAAMKRACPELAAPEQYTYYAPSFATTSDGLDPIRTWEAGLDADHDIAVNSAHNYIGQADAEGVTLQGTLMNHSSTVASVARLLNESRLLNGLPHSLSPNLPFIMGETNSLSHQGRPGLSNTFGAALWSVDFHLWCAANNIRRVHMHQGTNYRYQSWQPIDTDKTTKGTKAPYYADIAVASFLGDIVSSPPSIVNLPLPNEEEAAYASYVNGRLTKLIVINMQAYNRTDYNSDYLSNYTRPIEEYDFQLPSECGTQASLQRLVANGSDAITGVAFDGHSYNYELNNGKPVLLSNVTRGETARTDRHGHLKISLPRSSVVIANFD